jgi:hypothetical protein
MFVLIMDHIGRWSVTIHTTRAEAEQEIKKYAREGWVGKCKYDDEWPDNSAWPTTLAGCIKWLADGGEYVKLFRAELGGGLGEEIKLGDEVEAAQQAA